jgi:hypothetical protein
MDSADIVSFTAFGFFFAATLCALLVMVPRRNAPIPFILAVCYITIAQQFIIGGLHFTVVRVLILFAWLRLLMRGELQERGLVLNAIDRAIILWAASDVLFYCLRLQTTAALVNRLGFAFNVLGSYFFFRVMIKNFEEIDKVLKAITLIIAPLAIFMILESLTGRNVFFVFGGVPEFTWVREGRMRCQGPFRHPIMAGTFGATLVPMFVSLWVKGGELKRYGIIGVLSATVITITSASSGPAMAYFFCLAGLAMWRWRAHMRQLRWAVITIVFILNLVMKAPVWFLIARLSNVLGGTGWHRAELISSAIRHIDEWWLCGTSHTAHWMPYVLPSDPEMTDITSYYILQGVEGGLLTMFLFIVVIVLCFKGIGEVCKVYGDQPFLTRFAVWALGAALFGHVMSFLSVAYFDQITVIWYLLLAMISTLVSKNLKSLSIFSRAGASINGQLIFHARGSHGDAIPLSSLSSKASNEQNKRQIS